MLTIVNETTNFIKTVVFRKSIVFGKENYIRMPHKLPGISIVNVFLYRNYNAKILDIIVYINRVLQLVEEM